MQRGMKTDQTTHSHYEIQNIPPSIVCTTPFLKWFHMMFPVYSYLGRTYTRSVHMSGFSSL